MARTRTLDRILNLRLPAGATSILDEAVGAWKANTFDSVNSRLTDLTGRGHHAAFPGGVNNPTRLDYAGQQFCYLPGIAANYISTPDSAAVSITGDIDIRVKAAMDDWTPTAQQCLVGKFITGSRSYRFEMGSDGKPFIDFSADGSVSAGTVASSVATGFVDGTTNWVRVTWRQSDGRLQFFTSGDGAAWTQLGTDRSLVIASIFDGTSELQFGAHGGGSDMFAGKLYYAEIRNGINGTVAASFDASRAVEPYATVLGGQGETWTFNRAATGKKLAVVDRTMLLFGTDDLLDIADDDDLDFALTDSFTIVAAVRRYGSAAGLVLIGKQAGVTSTTLGWQLRSKAAAGTLYSFSVGDGTAGAAADTGAWTVGTAQLAAGVRNTSADTLTGYVNAALGTPVTDTTTATSANANVVRIGGATDSTAFIDMELIGLAVFRRALKTSELAQVAREFGVAA